MAHPLEDPTYIPLHPPVDGLVPEVVSKWGPRSQIRWFQKFRGGLNWLKIRSDEYYTGSEEHRGGCCYGCYEEYWDGPGCCCHAFQPEEK